MHKDNGLFFVLSVASMLFAGLVAGCGSMQSSYEQQFQGVITKDKKPVASERVRLVTASSDECDTKGLEAETDKKGKFRMSRLTRGDDNARPYRLCVLAGDTWETLWGETRGPAPRSVEFECDLTDKYKDKCWVSWDKEGFRRGSWSK